MYLSPMQATTQATTPSVAGTATPDSRAAAPAAAPVSAPNNATPSTSDVEKALKTLNEFTAMAAQDVSFAMDEESGKTIVKVVDTATQEVLRQFPSAEALSIAHSIDKMQGLLIREKA